ncbi:tetratricopeptide repeat protein [Lysobacter fragariae]
MTLFVVCAALLAVLVLGFVLRPLLVGSRVVGVTLVGALVVIAASLYALLGTPRAFDSTQLRAPETLGDAVTQLEAQLQREPNQPEGWRLLARAYASQGETNKARDAFERAVKLAPDEPDLLAEAAEARALANEHRFDEAAIALLRHALEKQPMHQRARWFLGISQRQSGQPAEAAKTWEPLLAIVDDGTASGLLEQINLARKEAGLAALPPRTPVNAASSGLRVKVSVSPALASKLPANATLFVLARQPDGPPMPVAVEKIAVEKPAAAGFPLEVTLDDGDSPMPTMKLSQIEQVVVSARISASGDAIGKAGDFEATAKTMNHQGTVELVIDHVRP